MTQYLLITDNPEKVLVTISSRCQRIRVCPPAAGLRAEFTEYALFADLMDTLVARNLGAALEVGDRIAALPSREAAKSFCRGSAEALRQVFLVQQGVKELSAPDEKTAFWASKCRKTFPRMALEALSRAVSLIDRNVNIKIIATDLVDRLYTKI